MSNSTKHMLTKMKPVQATKTDKKAIKQNPTAKSGAAKIKPQLNTNASTPQPKTAPPKKFDEMQNLMELCLSPNRKPKLTHKN